MSSEPVSYVPEIGKDECWRAVLEFDSEKGFADHQLRSFDYFLSEDVPEIVEETLPLVYVTPNILGPQQQVDDDKSLVLKEASHVVHVFRFCSNAKVGYPTISYVDSDPRPITPYEARIEKQNYAAPINITICHERYAYHKKHMPTPIALDATYETHCIGMMPIMVGSSRCWTRHPNNPKSLVQMKECELDSGGYFIVNGVEKVIISQEHMRQNIINVFTRKPSGKAVLVAEVRSARNRLRGSISPLNLKTVKQCSLLQPTEVNCQVPYIKSEVPIFLLFRALGFDDLPTLKRMIGAEFYQTYDLKTIDHRLEEQPEENDKQLVRLINISWNSANACATSVEQAKLWLGKRAHQPYGDENWQTQKKNDKRKRRGKNAKTQENNEPEELNANRKLFKSIDEILTRDLLPHLTPPELLRSKSPLSDEVQVQDASIARKKLVFIVHMLCRLWRVQMGLDKENDRDHNAHKRFDAAGPLFAQLFTQHYYKMIKDVRKYLSRSATTGKPLSFSAGIKTKTITHGMIYACSTGNWPNQKSATPHTGVSQTVNRMNYNAFLSHMRRLNTPIDKTNSKLTGPRALHETSWGTNDPSETPEGEPCGLIKNMALCALITIAQDCTYIRHFLSKENIIPLDKVLHKVQNATCRDPMAPPLPKKQKLASSEWTFESLAEMTRVYLNGEWLGYHHQGKDLADRLKEMRRQNIIPYEAAIIYSDKEHHPRTLYISLEGGRSCYPVFVVTRVKTEDGKVQNRLKFTRQHVEKLKIALTSRYGWDDLLRDGVVEFLDSHEKEYAFIAPYQVDIYDKDAPAYTHCEIDPSIILGVSSGQIPNSNSNQAARNT
uniref:DNA-directed RNA polymerase n=1 Tax=Clandestinovirus TaxID=2831644 RepID=A0A8F8KNA8_9VIRU|nr:DNA-directed RNA polymerase II subunit 2 [Clandestinovirus]